MARKGRTKVIYKGTFVSKRSLLQHPYDSGMFKKKLHKLRNQSALKTLSTLIDKNVTLSLHWKLYNQSHDTQQICRCQKKISLLCCARFMIRFMILPLGRWHFLTFKPFVHNNPIGYLHHPRFHSPYHWLTLTAMFCEKIYIVFL